MARKLSWPKQLQCRGPSEGAGAPLVQTSSDQYFSHSPTKRLALSDALFSHTHPIEYHILMKLFKFEYISAVDVLNKYKSAELAGTYATGFSYATK